VSATGLAEGHLCNVDLIVAQGEAANDETHGDA
jgi:hypothetical protein